MNLTFNQLLKLWPRAHAGLLQSIADASDIVFERYLLTTPLRVAHFMAQCSHESGAGTHLVENLTYTSPERLMQVWPKRFPTINAATPYVRNPKGLARLVYNGRMGNRPGTDDGFTYRGQGIIQLTGRDAYERIGKLAGLDLLAHPEMAAGNEHCLSVAGAFWSSKPLNAAADKDNLQEVTRLINGGNVGINDRAKWLKSWKAELHA